MKKYLLFFALSFCFALTSFGQTKFGAGATYIDDFGVQARASLGVGDNLGLIPSFSYYFTDGFTAISVDGNLTYGVAEVGDGIPIYALGGLDWTRVSSNGFSNSEIGINLGGGLEAGSIYGEIFYRALFCDGCGGDIGLNVGYYFGG